MSLRATLPPDRAQAGTLRVLDGHDVRLECPCLGKSDNAAAAKAGNPTRDPLRKMGDLPTGAYRARPGLSLARDAASTRSYGPHPVIALEPLAGDALRAKQNGRSGLLIHGGALGPNGKLRPTLGCLRLSNDDQESLVVLLDGKDCECIVEESSNGIS